MNSFKKIFFFLIILSFSQIYSIEPGEVLKDKILEERARKISKELRCLVCQNEDIDSSNADIARDLRSLVREKLLNGESDKDIITYIHQKYGDFVLYSPPFRLDTLLLWFFPFFIFLFLLFFLFRRKN